MAFRRFFVILNENAGTAQSLGLSRDALAARFEREGFEAEVVSDFSGGLDPLVAQAKASYADVIVVGGGDGSATGVADKLMDSGRPLLILPLGTANALARDLLLELDIDRWFGSLDALEERRIDVGCVNGINFLHMVVIGLMPGIAAGREKVRSHPSAGAFFKFLGFLGRRFARARRIDVEIKPEGAPPENVRVSALAVGNNLFDAEFGHVFSRQVLDDGKLSLYLLRRISPWTAIRLAFEMLFGTWQQDEEISLRETQGLTVNTRRRTVKVMLDGEPMSLTGPLHFQIKPKALTVLAPPPVVQAETAA